MGEQGVELVGGEMQRRRPGEMRHKTGPLGLPSRQRSSSLEGQLKWSRLTRQRGGEITVRRLQPFADPRGVRCTCIYVVREQTMYLKELVKVKCPFQAHSEPNARPSLTVPSI